MPLRPVYAAEYLELAPHVSSYENLEVRCGFSRCTKLTTSQTAHRDIMSSLEYNFGGTPQALLDELWDAIPSLRELMIDMKWWHVVVRETWIVLLSALMGMFITMSLHELISTLNRTGCIALSCLSLDWGGGHRSNHCCG